jgi:hypothetical protein
VVTVEIVDVAGVHEPVVLGPGATSRIPCHSEAIQGYFEDGMDYWAGIFDANDIDIDWFTTIASAEEPCYGGPYDIVISATTTLPQ